MEQTKLPFKNSHAFIIGINDYKKLSKLNTAVNDAKKLAEVLAEEQGFKVHSPLLNASCHDITHLLEKTIIDKVGLEDRVFFYFAGHGIALDGDNRPEGYIVPADAIPENVGSLVSMNELYHAINKLPCKHLLLILDCCFSGAFKWSSRYRHIASFMPKLIFKERFDRFIKDPAWQVITSSAYDQKALDVLQEKSIGKRDNTGVKHSPFAYALFDALRGKADVIPADGGDGVITASELYLYLREQVEPQTIEADEKLRQTPRIFPLEKHDKGEYIFLHPTHRLNLPPAPKRNPYKGLLSFEEDDTELFYGRERVIKKLLQKMGESNLLVVTGASGSGKSSVVKAGLIPELRKQGYNILPVIRPGKTPVTSFEEALRKSKLFSGNISLNNHMDVISKELSFEKTVLVIDQFEELITQCSKEEDKNLFIDVLEKLLDSNKENLLKIVLTIRVDFEPQFIRSELEKYWRDSRYTVPPFTTEELREIIVKPTIQEVFFIEPPELVDRIINEVIQAPGALPLLSFTLSELYRLYIDSRREDRVLHEDDYRKIGGIIGALRKRADNIYDSLNPEHQNTMRKIMLRMVSVEGGELAGKKVLMENLEFSEEENLRVKTIIDKLLEARLILKDKDPDNQIYVEPAHDALIRAWATLWEWIKLYGEDKILLQNLLDAAVKDFADKNNKIWLWHNNPRLDLLKTELHSKNSWLNKNEVTFVEKSIKLKGQKRRRFITFLIIIIIVLSGLTVFSIYKAKIAERNLRRSEANRLAAIAEAKAKDDPTIALRIAEEALKFDRNKQVTETIHNIYRENNFYKIILDSKYYSKHVIFSPDGRYLLAGAVENTARLWDLKEGQLLTLAEQKKSVTSMAFSPDGKYILTGSADNTARLWDLKGYPLKVFEGHTANVESVVFSPDGKCILTGSGDGTANLWDLKGNRLQSFHRHKGSVLYVAFSPDGEYILTGSNDKTSRLWDLKGNQLTLFKMQRGPKAGNNYVNFSPDGKYILADSPGETTSLWDLKGNQLQTFKKYKDGVNFVTFSPDGKHILQVSGDTVRLWNLRENKLQFFKRKVNGLCASFSPNGKFILIGLSDGTSSLWDLKGKELQVFTGHKKKVARVTFSPDGKYILTGSLDNSAQLWDLKGNQLQAFKGHKRGVDGLTFSPDGRYILTISNDAICRLWYLERIKSHTLIKHKGSVSAVAFSPDGESILTSSLETAQLWELKGKKSQDLSGHKSSITCVDFSPKGKYILTGSWDKTARLWDLKGNQLQVFDGHVDTVYSVNFSPDGKYILSGSRDKTARLWDLEGNQLQVFKHKSFVYSASFSPDSKYILTGSHDANAHLWDLKGKELQVLKGHKNSVEFVGFSPDGKYILTGSDRVVRLLNLHGKELQVLRVDNYYDLFHAVTFSPNGKYILTGSGKGTARLWDLKGNELQIFKGHEDAVISVAISPDCKFILTGSKDKTSRLWQFMTLEVFLEKGNFEPLSDEQKKEYGIK